MIGDAQCPYCGESQDINHDDGYGYDESELYSQKCISCDKKFVFTTLILFLYETSKADCLNGGEHKYKPTRTHPVEYTKMECTDCGDRRKPTNAEMALIMEANDK